MAADSAFRFREHTIATDLKGGYQVVAVDMNNDGRLDLLAVGTGMDELVWYENPGWRRHVIARGQSRMINAAPWDVDGDGIPELVLASGFSMDPAKSSGIISFLKNKGDPKGLWEIAEIDRLPSSHRLRWADIDGSGRRVAINVPLAGGKAAPPDFKDRVPIVLYRPGAWKRELISDALSGAAHGMAVLDWDGNGQDAVLVASFEGIHLFRFGGDGRWTTSRLATGNPEEWPQSGASDIATGRLGQRRFLATIEPWHGHILALYAEQGGSWRRSVIEDAFLHGHALLAADLNNDGLDEIVAGFRGDTYGVNIYSSADRWTRHSLDTSLAASACDVADLNGNGLPDLVCIGGSTLKWYENTGE